MIVIDASAALELLLATTAGKKAARIVDRNGERLHAPHVIDLEVLHVLRRLVLFGQLTPARAGRALDDFADLRIRRYGHLALADRIWELRDNATAYDAAYLALAEALPGTLLTCDAALAKVPGLRACVETI